MLKRFNAMLCRDLSAFVLDEADWDRHVSFAVFRCICSQNTATGLSPFHALFGVETFEFEASLGLQLRLEAEPDDVAGRMRELHTSLARMAARSLSKA